jgi:myo-inositol-1(or 4)-monophosphatase
MQGLTSAALDAAAALAERAARHAGALLLEAKAQWQAVDSQVGRDIKLRADREADAVVLGMLAEGSPYPVLSEESGEVGSITQAGAYWVVDPLDGTYNYFRNVPLCCVSVGLCAGDHTPLLGCINDFNHGEVFSGGPGRGVWRNGAPLPSAGGAEFLATGLPRKGDFSNERLAQFGPRVAQWKQLRLLGSAALSLAWTAAGRLDAYEEAGIMWWDVAAGIALVRAAGGTVTVAGDVLRQPLDVRAYRGAPPGGGTSRTK